MVLKRCNKLFAVFVASAEVCRLQGQRTAGSCARLEGGAPPGHPDWRIPPACQRSSPKVAQNPVGEALQGGL
eukprot:4973328-Alexandrium_andersonii.AAC.1